MAQNPTIELMLNRKSIRKYTDRKPSDETIETVVRAGQQAPFAYQFCSVLLTRKRKKIPSKAPLLFTICLDAHKFERIMEKRDWRIKSCDLSILLFGLQDAILMAENMVIAAESLGMGSCFLGYPPYAADKIAAEYKLPPRVYPIVGLAMGYPAENPPPRPRYPLRYTLFEDRYPELTDDMVEEAMQVMDDGYRAQDYYKGARLKLPLEDGRAETFTFDDYSWTEHICRKVGQWSASPKDLLDKLESRGFDIRRGE